MKKFTIYQNYPKLINRLETELLSKWNIYSRKYAGDKDINRAILILIDTMEDGRPIFIADDLISELNLNTSYHQILKILGIDEGLYILQNPEIAFEELEN